MAAAATSTGASPPMTHETRDEQEEKSHTYTQTETPGNFADAIANELAYIPPKESRTKRALHPVLYFYLSPVTDQLPFSINGLWFQPLNFFWTIGLFIYATVSISVSVSLIVLACVGVPLLWFSFEWMILFSRVELWFLVKCIEVNPDLRSNRHNKTELAMYSKGRLPRCGCDLRRFKFIFTSPRMLLIILYELIFKPVFTACFSWVVLLPYIAFSFIFMWLPFCLETKWFKHGHYKIGTWKIDSGGDVFACFVVGVLMLPLSLKLNNYACRIIKQGGYLFLSALYRSPISEDDTRRLLTAVKNVGENISDNLGSTLSRGGAKGGRGAAGAGRTGYGSDGDARRAVPTHRRVISSSVKGDVETKGRDIESGGMGGGTGGGLTMGDPDEDRDVPMGGSNGHSINAPIAMEMQEIEAAEV